MAYTGKSDYFEKWALIKLIDTPDQNRTCEDRRTRDGRVSPEERDIVRSGIIMRCHCEDSRESRQQTGDRLTLSFARGLLRAYIRSGTDTGDIILQLKTSGWV